MSYLFMMIWAFISPNEINIANSLDWLCYNSSTIAKVKVTEVKDENFTIGEFESEVTIRAEVESLFKGGDTYEKEIIIYSRLSYVGTDKWKNMKGRSVLVFLQVLACEEGCVYRIWDDDRGMIDLESPGSKAITGTFKVLKNKEQIYAYGKECIGKIPEKTAQPYFLETPYESEAFHALYQGSACYLVVPDIYYPASKKTLRD